MPRQTKKKIKGQKQVEAQKTYDFTVPKREIHARRVDPMEQQFISPGAKNLMSFVEQIGKTSQAGIRLNEMLVGEQRKKGARLGARGEKLPQGKHWAFIEGYEGFKGETATGDYTGKMEELFQKAGQLSPNEWDGEKEKISQVFMNGATDAFIDKFVPRAAKIEEQFDTRYQKVLKTQLENDYLTETRKMAQSELVRIFNDTEIIKEKKGEVLRKSLTNEQDRGKKLQIADKTEISTQFVETIIEKASTDGRPDYLDFAFEADPSGFKLIDRPELADALWAGLRTARSKKETLENKKIEDKKKLIEDARDDIERQIVWALETNELDTAAKNIGKYQSILDPDDLSKYMKRANALSLESSWAKVNNAEWYRLAYKRAATGRLTGEDWVMAYKYVTRDGYIELAKVNAKGKEELAKDVWGMRGKFEKKKNRLLDNVSPVNPLTKKYFDVTNGKARAEYIDDTMDLLCEDFVRTNSYEKLTVEQIIKWRNETRRDALEQWPIIMDISAQISQAASGKTAQQVNTGGAQKQVGGPLSLTNRLDALNPAKEEKVKKE